jgi:hypothetical protein
MSFEDDEAEKQDKQATAEANATWYDTNGTEDTRPVSDFPFQPLVMDDHDILRFKKNAIVRELLDRDPGIHNVIGPAGSGLNRISYDVVLGRHTAEDYSQLMQLIGYSIGGYGELTIVPAADRAEADKRAEVFLAALHSRTNKETTS